MEKKDFKRQSRGLLRGKAARIPSIHYRERYFPVQGDQAFSSGLLMLSFHELDMPDMGKLKPDLCGQGRLIFGSSCGCSLEDVISAQHERWAYLEPNLETELS